MRKICNFLVQDNEIFPVYQLESLYLWEILYKLCNCTVAQNCDIYCLVAWRYTETYDGLFTSFCYSACSSVSSVHILLHKQKHTRLVHGGILWELQICAWSWMGWGLLPFVQFCTEAEKPCRFWSLASLSQPVGILASIRMRTLGRFLYTSTLFLF